MIVETRHRLQEWGRWSSGGMPRLSNMFVAMWGRGGMNTYFMPPHIEQIDLIVCQAGEHRAILVQAYTMPGDLRHKALVLGISKSALARKLDRAEWYVNSILDGVNTFAPSMTGTE